MVKFTANVTFLPMQESQLMRTLPEMAVKVTAETAVVAETVGEAAETAEEVAETAVPVVKMPNN